MNNELFFWDIRLRDIRLRQGEITSAQEKMYLQKLPDVASKSAPIRWVDAAPLPEAEEQ